MGRQAFTINGSEVLAAVELSRNSPSGLLTAKIGDTPHDFSLRSIGGRSILEFSDRSSKCEVVHAGDKVWIWIDGQVYIAEKVNVQRLSNTSGNLQLKELVAPMPGTILKIEKKVGESYSPQDALIVMESMKMELTLSAPSAGRVAELFCEVGELVSLGKALARLEPEHS